MARKFFFVCAGLLCLAVAYHLGARNATAQCGAMLDGAHIDSPGGPVQSAWITGAIGRTFYWNGQPVGPPIPGNARVIATDGTNSSQWPYAVLLENGDFYYGTGTEWTYYGNVCGAAPTPAQQETWGNVKARYR